MNKWRYLVWMILLATFGACTNTKACLRKPSFLLTMQIGKQSYLLAGSNDDIDLRLYRLSETGELGKAKEIRGYRTKNTSCNNLAKNLCLRGLSAATNAVIGKKNYIFVSAYIDNAITVMQIKENGKLEIRDSIEDKPGCGGKALCIGGPISLAVLQKEASTYLVAAGFLDDGISVFQVGTNGKLTNLSNIKDRPGCGHTFPCLKGIYAVTTSQVNTKAYIFTAAHIDNGISVFEINDTGTLHNLQNIADNPGCAGAKDELCLADVRSLATIKTKVAHYLFVAGLGDNGISVFRISENGSLESVFNIADTPKCGGTQLCLAQPHSLHTAILRNLAYLIVAGRVDNGLSMFRINHDGSLVNRFNVTQANYKAGRSCKKTDDPSCYKRVRAITTGRVHSFQYLFINRDINKKLSKGITVLRIE